MNAPIHHPKTPNADDVAVGGKIRLFRMMAGMSQEKLGDHCGITFQQIQKYEKGTNRVGASRLKQIAGALGTTPSAFFDDDAPGAVAAVTFDAATLEIARLVQMMPAGQRQSVRNIVRAIAEATGATPAGGFTVPDHMVPAIEKMIGGAA